jgi:uncharacterized membrane protein
MQCHSIFSFEWNLIVIKSIHFFMSKDFDTLHKMFNVKIVGIDIKDPCILQGNMLSFLLCNIYFHK